MHDDLRTEFEKKAAPTLTVDWQLYAEFLEDSDMTDAEKREVIETLWTIVVGFIDLGFDVRSPDQACGQVSEDGLEPGSDVIPSIVQDWTEATRKKAAPVEGPKPPRRGL